MIVADVHLSDLILTTLWLFFLFMFIWVFIVIVSDLFRDHTLSGWAKAIWIVALILFPLIGSLIYLIARGPSMAERSAREQEQAKAQFDSYVRQTAGSTGTSAVDDLSRLAALRDNGTISDAEFESMKSRVTTGGAGASA